MADLSPIQNLLDDIKNAIYGEQVRTAIHDSIARCYTDVDNSKTLATSAADDANAVADEARGVITRANNAINNANEAADEASSAASNAQTQADEARSAAASATTATANANTARDKANTAATNATNAARSATDAATSAIQAATNADNARDSATDAARSATEAATDALTQARAAETMTSQCDTARLNAITATKNANSARDQASSAASTIENMSVSSENVSPDTQASVRITTVEGHKNLHFLLRQGATGAPFVIKGHAYSTLSELESDITSPAIGDMYNVGASEPYELYRWTGSNWETQGQLGVNFENLTDTEIDSIWNSTPVSSGKSKYINHTGLFYLINNKIQAAFENIQTAFENKVDKVDGKGLSTKDFTQAYIDDINENTSAIETLTNEKVSKVDGKGLSTNDYTTAEKMTLDRVNSLVGTDTLSTDTKVLTGAVNELNSHVINQAILHGQTAAISSAGNNAASTYTFYNSKITQTHKILYLRINNPEAVRGVIGWSTGNGSISFTVTIADGYKIIVDFYLINEITEITNTQS
jgi:chemotaxis protein histidine kinase CheA